MKGKNYERYTGIQQNYKNDQTVGAMGFRFSHWLNHRWCRRLVFTCALFLISGCFHDQTRDEHAAKMFANILITAEAQTAEGAPPIQQTAGAIQTAAKAGLKVLDYEIER